MKKNLKHPYPASQIHFNNDISSVVKSLKIKPYNSKGDNYYTNQILKVKQLVSFTL